MPATAGSNSEVLQGPHIVRATLCCTPTFTASPLERDHSSESDVVRHAYLTGPYSPLFISTLIIVMLLLL